MREMLAELRAFVMYDHPAVWLVRLVWVVVFAAWLGWLAGCDDGHACNEWCEETYNVEGWLDAANECICDIPCCWECGVGNAACEDICSDDPLCIDY